MVDKVADSAPDSLATVKGASLTVRLQQLISRLQEVLPAGPQLGKFTSWANPPMDVLDCVLSLNRSYDRFCLPRVESFNDRHPEIDSLEALLSLIRSYQ